MGRSILAIATNEIEEVCSNCYESVVKIDSKLRTICSNEEYLSCGTQGVSRAEMIKTIKRLLGRALNGRIYWRRVSVQGAYPWTRGVSSGHETPEATEAVRTMHFPVEPEYKRMKLYMLSIELKFENQYLYFQIKFTG